MSLKELIGFFLSNNNLSGVIPEEIGNLEGLKELYFDGNNLKGSIPESIWKSKRT